MTTILVMAKAPIPGAVKTRLAADLGGRLEVAADLAAAALLDTITACVAAVGAARCRLSISGDLTAAVRSPDLALALAGWTIVPQRGERFDERLANAHLEVPGPVVQIGMDTPQVTAATLRELVDSVNAGCPTDAVLAPATDGGWWALGLSSGTYGEALRGVVMSRPDTHAMTMRALRTAGLQVGGAPVLTDADHLTDAREIASSAPHTRFATAIGSLDANELAS